MLFQDLDVTTGAIGHVWNLQDEPSFYNKPVYIREDGKFAIFYHVSDHGFSGWWIEDVSTSSRARLDAENYCPVSDPTTNAFLDDGHGGYSEGTEHCLDSQNPALVSGLLDYQWYFVYEIFSEDEEITCEQGKVGFELISGNVAKVEISVGCVDSTDLKVITAPIEVVSDCNQYGIPMDSVIILEETVQNLLSNFTLTIENLEPIGDSPWFYVIAGFHGAILMLVLFLGVVSGRKESKFDVLKKQSVSFFDVPYHGDPSKF